MAISKEQLEGLTELLNDRFGEFGSIMDLPKFSMGSTRVIHGVFEEWYEKSQAAQQEMGEGCAFRNVPKADPADSSPYNHKMIPVVTPPTLEAIGIGDDPSVYASPSGPIVTTDHSNADNYGPQNGAQKYSELSFPSGPFGDYPPGDDPAHQAMPLSGVRLPEIKPPQSSNNGDDEPESGRKGKRGNVLPTLDEFVAELRRQSMAGIMPSQGQFNDSKPANWATAAAHMQRFGLSWLQLMARAGLKPRPKELQEKDLAA